MPRHVRCLFLSLEMLHHVRYLFLAPWDALPCKISIPHSQTSPCEISILHYLRYLVMWDIYSSLLKMRRHARYLFFARCLFLNPQDTSSYGCLFLAFRDALSCEMSILRSLKCFTMRNVYSLLLQITRRSRCLFIVLWNASTRKMFIPRSLRYFFMWDVYFSLFEMRCHTRCLFITLRDASSCEMYIFRSLRCLNMWDIYSPHLKMRHHVRLLFFSTHCSLA